MVAGHTIHFLSSHEATSHRISLRPGWGLPGDAEPERSHVVERDPVAMVEPEPVPEAEPAPAVPLGETARRELLAAEAKRARKQARRLS